MNSSRETLKGGFACPKCCWNSTKKVIFASDCYWWSKMDRLRQPQAQKIICETRPSSQINGKAEYPWLEGNALYLVGSEGCAVLCILKSRKFLNIFLWNPFHKFKWFKVEINLWKNKNTRIFKYESQWTVKYCTITRRKIVEVILLYSVD